MEENLDQPETNGDDLLQGLFNGVKNLFTQVEILNKRVYTKNKLDEIKTKLFRLTTGVALFLSSLIIGLLVVVIIGNHNESNNAKARAQEASDFRHQLADCQLPKGAVLKDGFVNEGKCFSDNQTRATKFLENGANKISDNLRLSINCLYLRSEGKYRDFCKDTNDRLDSMDNNINPFEKTTPSE